MCGRWTADSRLVRVAVGQHLAGDRRGRRPLVPAAGGADGTADGRPRGRRRVRLVDHVLAGLGQQLLERDDQRQDQRDLADDHRLAGHQEQQAERQRYDHHGFHRGHRHHHPHGLLHFAAACGADGKTVRKVRKRIVRD